ncbi:MAG: GTP cyclohydrolase [Pyrinomonadaceae bacterium]
MNMRLAERQLKTRFGNYNEILFYDGKSESVALVMGDVEDEEHVLCRVHSSCLSAHVFNSIECECREEMEKSQALIEQAGIGVIIWLDHEGKGNGHLALMKSIKFKKEGFNQGEAYEKAGYEADARSFHSAADILNDLKVKSVVLLTNSPDKADDLRRASINISETLQITTLEESESY